MHPHPKRVLLVNPWIYDFVAYDFWVKPLGLLILGGILRKYGYEIHLLDCLDRHHPHLLKYLDGKMPQEKMDGTGKFVRTEIDKPAILRHIPRKYCRYGFPPALVEDMLQELPAPPDAILITSMMNFWYLSVKDMVKTMRRYFPQVPIILGGVYATLCTCHAQQEIQPDFLVKGNGEEQIIPLLNRICGNDYENYDGSDITIPYDLYPNLRSIAIATSFGCPYHCSFCASKQLVPEYRQRPSKDVINEICYWHKDRKIEHVCFYDDALLYRAEHTFIPLLRTLITLGLPIQLHTPNGLQPRCIDEEIAHLFYKANVKTIRLSFESSNSSRQRALSSKVTNNDLKQALINLENAGYKRDEIIVYVIMGLADQEINEVRESVLFVRSLGANVSIASFSPIPGTIEWQNSLLSGYWNEEDDLLLTNPSVFPLWSRKVGYHQSQDLLKWAKANHS